jgi:hypothetical protein
MGYDGGAMFESLEEHFRRNMERAYPPRRSAKWTRAILLGVSILNFVVAIRFLFRA